MTSEVMGLLLVAALSGAFTIGYSVGKTTGYREGERDTVYRMLRQPKDDRL